MKPLASPFLPPSDAQLLCRFCLTPDTPTSSPAACDLVQPCSCKGTAANVHIQCLHAWQRTMIKCGNVKRATVCTVCQCDFTVEPPSPSFYEQFAERAADVRRGLARAALLLAMASFLVLAPPRLLLHLSFSVATILIVVVGALYARGMRMQAERRATEAEEALGLLDVQGLQAVRGDVHVDEQIRGGVGDAVAVNQRNPLFDGLSLWLRRSTTRGRPHTAAAAPLTPFATTAPTGLAAGALLVAATTMPRGVFRDAVVLLLDFSPLGGARGVVLNSRMAQHVVAHLAEAGLVPTIAANVDNAALFVGLGGPVAQTAVTTLASGDVAALLPGSAAVGVGTDIWRVPSSQAWTMMQNQQSGAQGDGVADEHEEVHALPRGIVRSFVGLACWAPGQLDLELRMSCWGLLPVGGATASLAFFSQPTGDDDDDDEGLSIENESRSHAAAVRAAVAEVVAPARF